MIFKQKSLTFWFFVGSLDGLEQYVTAVVYDEEQLSVVEKARMAMARLQELKAIRKPRDIEVIVPEEDQMNYEHCPRGRILFKGHTYYFCAAKGQQTVNMFKCIFFKSSRCKVTLKTAGRKIFSICGEHNH